MRGAAGLVPSAPMVPYSTSPSLLSISLRSINAAIEYGDYSLAIIRSKVAGSSN